MRPTLPYPELNTSLPSRPGLRRLSCLCLALIFGSLLWAQPLFAAPPSTAQAKQAVRKWLKNRLPNPGAYKELNWSKEVKHITRGPYLYSIRHYYLLRSNQGVTYHDRIFLFDADGLVAGVEDLILGREPLEHNLRPPTPKPQGKGQPGQPAPPPEKAP